MLNLIENLESSAEFISWKKNNKNSYFCSAFAIIESGQEPVWQLDYYDPDEDKVTGFIVKDKIEKQESEKAFKKAESKINGVKREDIKINYDEAVKIAKNILKKNYKSQKYSKIIAILQSLGQPLWNITMLTEAFEIINIKISSIDGKIISRKKESLLKYKKDL